MEPGNQGGAETSDAQKKAEVGSVQGAPGLRHRPEGKHRREAYLPDWKLPGYLKGSISHLDCSELIRNYLHEKWGRGGRRGCPRAQEELVRNDQTRGNMTNWGATNCWAMI